MRDHLHGAFMGALGAALVLAGFALGTHHRVAPAVVPACYVGAAE